MVETTFSFLRERQPLVTCSGLRNRSPVDLSILTHDPVKHRWIEAPMLGIFGDTPETAIRERWREPTPGRSPMNGANP